MPRNWGSLKEIKCPFSLNYADEQVTTSRVAEDTEFILKKTDHDIITMELNNEF